MSLKKYMEIEFSQESLLGEINEAMNQFNDKIDELEKQNEELIQILIETSHYLHSGQFNWLHRGCSGHIQIDELLERIKQKPIEEIFRSMKK